MKIAAVLCENIVKESLTQIWTSPSEEEEEEEEKKKKKKKEKKKKKKKKKKEKHFGRLATFRFGTFAMLFRATGCVVRHDER